MFARLRQRFEEALFAPSLKKPVLRVPGRPSADNSYYHTFYPTQQLSELTDVLKILDADEPLNDRFTARYLVTKEKTLLFAREGRPGVDIPAHREIRGECLAAGNILFSEDYEHITGVNHQSGDFHSTQGSMVWVIAILLFMNAPIADSFTLILSNEVAGDFVSTRHEITKEALAALVPDAIHEIDLSANQTLSIERHMYQDTRFEKKRKYAFFTPTPAPTAPAVNIDNGYDSP